MRVQVAASLSVNQTNNVVVTDEAQLLRLRVVVGVLTVRIKEPVVVGVLVVVASDLLLSRSLGIGLNVRVEETTTVTHVLDRGLGTNGNLQGAVLSDFGALQVGLEEGAHLGVAGAALVEDSEVQSEGQKVNEEWNEDETNGARDEVGCESRLSRY